MRAEIGEPIPRESRNDHLINLAEAMRRRGMGSEEILGALQVTNDSRDPPLRAEHLRGMVRVICEGQPTRGRRQRCFLWEHEEPPDREFVVEHPVPARKLTSLYGDGGVRKDLPG